MSLLPSATEIVAALGAHEALVGVSHECDHPSQVTGLPRVTGSCLDAGLDPEAIDRAVADASLAGRPLYRVDGELLASLAPDLVLTQGVCAVCAVTAETIEAGLRLLPLETSCSAPILSLQARDYAGIKADIVQVGEALGLADEARALCADMDTTWSNAGSGSEQSPSVLMLEWPDPPWVGGHWVPEQVCAAGGVPLLGRPGEPSDRTDWEAVAAADPDWIVAAACGFNLEANLHHARSLLDDARAASLRAVREGRFWAVDANSFFSRPGPRVAEGAQLLGDLLQGREPAADRACRVTAAGGVV